MSADRTAQIDAFLARAGWASAVRGVLADDASFRRYDRVRLDGRQAVLMDAPPSKEDIRPFVTVARLLQDINLSVPNILAEDHTLGFLLLEDLGDDTYTKVLARGGDEAALYGLAVDVLIALHQRFKATDQIPVYAIEKLLDEAALLTDWYWPAVKGSTCPERDRTDYLSLWRAALLSASGVPDSLVLRDYHVDNLMHLAGRDGIAACGLLDFQDAVTGPVTYDLVSLLEDARRDVPDTLSDAMICRYQSAFPELDPAAFDRSYAILGAQRASKIIGIFARLDRRDDKAAYLKHVPRTWRWLEGDLSHPALSELTSWYARHFPDTLRIAPEP